MKKTLRSNLVTGSSKHARLARMIGEIIKLSHFINMTTDRRVDMHMNLPDKRYKQFYSSIDSDRIGSPVFLEEKDAEKKLRAIKKNLENILLEENKNGSK